MAIVWKPDLKGIKHKNREMILTTRDTFKKKGGMTVPKVLESACTLDMHKSIKSMVCSSAFCVQESGVEQHWVLSWRTVKIELL